MCAECGRDRTPSSALRVTGGQVAGSKISSAAARRCIVGAGTAQGIEPARTTSSAGSFRTRSTRITRTARRTTRFTPPAGSDIAEVHAGDAVATVTHACDEVMAGDYLEPFALPIGPPSPLRPARPI